MELTGIRLFKTAMILLVVGGLNWATTLFMKKDLATKVFGRYAWIVFVLVGLAALYVGFSRDTYLPFLGKTVFPCSLLKDSVPEGADLSVQVKVRPGAKVIFWASEPANKDLHELQDWRKAYMEFKNAGVTTADATGIATLSVRTPQSYTVPMKGALDAHIHYRECVSDGMVGRVETVKAESIQKMMKSQSADIQTALSDMETAMDTLEPFANYAPSAFDASMPPPDPATDNTLYEIAEQTEKNRITESMGFDESPQPAGTPYDAAFAETIQQ